jgi:phenylacetate-CoA ligase
MPLNLWSSRETIRNWYALFEARVRRWNGVTRHDRWAMLGGQLIVSVDRDKPPYWVWNAGMKQLYMSSYHLSPDGISWYLDALRRYEIFYVLGYASSMAALAQTALERGLAAPKLQVAISNAEPLTDSQRARVSSAFQCPVRDTYGMAEIVCGASECGSGTLHLWPEAGILEVLQDDTEESVPRGEAGRLVCTGLLNPDMPLVRYAVGDRGSLSAAPEACACGRRLPALASIEGRCDDVLVTPEGRRIGRLDPVFKADLPVREAQIIQEAIDRVRVKVVPVAGFDSGDANSIRRRLQQRLGASMDVIVETVAEIPRGSAGKFRAVVSLLGSEGR